MFEWLEVKNLKKQIWDNIILKNISFSIKKWKSVWFIWDNGAWKTTTIKILAWINKPDFWEILFDWKSVFEMTKNNKVWYLPEEAYFPNYLTGREFINFICNLNNIKINEKELINIFKELKLDEAIDKKIKEYSKWMMQRLWFISLIVSKKNEYLFLDEPMSWLDHVWQIETINIIKLLKNKWITIILTSHHMNEIEAICDEIIFIKKWEILEHKNVKDILKNFKTLKDYYLFMSQK